MKMLNRNINDDKDFVLDKAGNYLGYPEHIRTMIIKHYLMPPCVIGYYNV